MLAFTRRRLCPTFSGLVVGACLLFTSGRVAAQSSQQETASVAVQIGDLWWRPSGGQAPAISRSDYKAITHTLVAQPRLGGPKVTLGFNENGGGYLWSAMLQGFSRSGEVGNAGYGGGFLGAIRDQMHRGMYNPEQAGVNAFDGARTKVVQLRDAVLVPQFQLPIYNDGSGGGRSRFPISNYKSEFDFSALTRNVSAQFGIPAFAHEEYYAYARKPDAIKQFLSGAIAYGPDAREPVFDPAKRIDDISSWQGKQVPRDTDMSFLVHTIRGIRPPADFKYVLYRSGGQWQTKTLSTTERERGGSLACHTVLPGQQQYTFAQSGHPVRNFPGADCTLDSPLLIMSTSPDPVKGTAVGLFVPQDDPWNSQQIKIVDQKTLKVQRTEDRRMASTMFVGNFVKPGKMSSEGYWFVGARNFLSGLLSPASATEYYSRDSVEILTDKSFVLFGTAEEILHAVNTQSGAAPPVSDTTRASTAPQPAEPLPGSAYDIIVVAGQSNAVGRGIGPLNDDVHNQNEAGSVFQLGRFGGDNMKVIPAHEPLQAWGQLPGRSMDRKGFAFAFALRYAGVVPDGRKVLLIPAARGSTSILQWDDVVQPFSHARMKDSTELVDDMLARIKYVLRTYPGSRVVAVIWSQGEADVLQIANQRSDIHEYMVSADLYRQKLAALRDRIRNELPSQGCFPFLAAELARSWKPLNGQPAGMRAKQHVIDATRAAMDADRCNTPTTKASALVSSEDIEVNQDVPNSPHYSAAGAVRLGERFFSTFEIMRR